MLKLSKFFLIFLLLSTIAKSADAQDVGGKIIAIDSNRLVVDLNKSQLRVGNILDVYNPPKTVTNNETGEVIVLDEVLVGRVIVTGVYETYSVAEPESASNISLYSEGQSVYNEKIQVPVLTYKRGKIYADGVKVKRKNARQLLVDSDLYFKWRKAKAVKDWSDATAWIFPTIPVLAIISAGGLGIPGIPGAICFLNSKRRMKNIVKEFNSRDYSNVDYGYIVYQDMLKEKEFKRRQERDERFVERMNLLNQALGHANNAIAAGVSASHGGSVYSPASGSSSGGNNSYLTQYKIWERQAKSRYESLTNVGIRTKDSDGNYVSGTSGMGMVSTMGMQKLLLEAQRNMQSIRMEAARNGVEIPQSQYETVTVH